MEVLIWANGPAERHSMHPGQKYMLKDKFNTTSPDSDNSCWWSATHVCRGSRKPSYPQVLI